jgi:hypothetical protein
MESSDFANNPEEPKEALASSKCAKIKFLYSGITADSTKDAMLLASLFR